MSSCWKCGAAVPEGKTECEDGCRADADAEFKKLRSAMRDMAENRVEFDWDKVQTLEDMRELLSALLGCWGVDRRSPLFEKLKKFTKEAK